MDFWDFREAHFASVMRFYSMHNVWNCLYLFLGLHSEPKDLTLLQIIVRGIIVFTASLVMVRCGDRRSLAQKSAFDLVLIVVVASVLARAVNGSASFFPTLGGAFAIILLHRGMARIVCQWPSLAPLIKGGPVILAKDGQCDFQAMRSRLITPNDFDEDMRLDLKTENKAEIRVARLESSGDISFIKA